MGKNKFIIYYFSLILNLVFSSPLVFAEDPGALPPSFRPPAIWKEEMFFQLTQARIAYLDITALRKRFDPILSELNDAQFKEWYLGESAYISEYQISLIGIRVHNIPHNKNKIKIAFRPSEYRRGSVMPLYYKDKVVGWIDEKGSGSDEENAAKNFIKNQEAINEIDPEKKQKLLNELYDLDHSDGVMSGGEAVAELTRQKMLQALYNKAFQQGLGWWETVDTLAIIDPGFEIIRSTGNIPAAVYHREAHLGRVTLDENPFARGVAGAHQSTLSGATVDMGGFFQFKAIEKLKLDENEQKILKTHFFSVNNNPQETPSWIWGHKTFQAFREQINPKIILNHLHEMLGDSWESELRLKVHPESYEKIRKILLSLYGELSGEQLIDIETFYIQDSGINVQEGLSEIFKKNITLDFSLRSYSSLSANCETPLADMAFDFIRLKKINLNSFFKNKEGRKLFLSLTKAAIQKITMNPRSFANVAEAIVDLNKTNFFSDDLNAVVTALSFFVTCDYYLKTNFLESFIKADTLTPKQLMAIINFQASINLYDLQLSQDSILSMRFAKNDAKYFSGFLDTRKLIPGRQIKNKIANHWIESWKEEDKTLLKDLALKHKHASIQFKQMNLDAWDLWVEDLFDIINPSCNKSLKTKNLINAEPSK